MRHDKIIMQEAQHAVCRSYVILLQRMIRFFITLLYDCFIFPRFLTFSVVFSPKFFFYICDPRCIEFSGSQSTAKRVLSRRASLWQARALPLRLLLLLQWLTLAESARDAASRTQDGPAALTAIDPSACCTRLQTTAAPRMCSVAEPGIGGSGGWALLSLPPSSLSCPPKFGRAVADLEARGRQLPCRKAAFLEPN